MDDELQRGFDDLRRYREALLRTENAQVRATLYRFIRETEDRLAQLRREAYGPVARTTPGKYPT